MVSVSNSEAVKGDDPCPTKGNRQSLAPCYLSSPSTPCVSPFKVTPDLMPRFHLLSLVFTLLFISALCACSVTQLCPTLCDPMTIAHQAPLSMGFPRKEYWPGLLFPPPGTLPDPRIEPLSPVFPALASGFFTIEPLGKHLLSVSCSFLDPFWEALSIP